MAEHFSIQNALSADGLLATLAATDLHVPGRTTGRTTQQTERWTVCRLLATLTSIDRLRFPLSVSHEDKPDFRLEFDGRSVGIEVTEAISTDYSKCLALAEREKPGALIDMSLFRWGGEPKTTADLREIIQATELQGGGWDGESAEVEWAHYIESIVSVKSRKAAAYTHHDCRWLAIYDNLPLPHVHLARGAEKLRPLLAPWDDHVEFHAVFIEHGPVILELTPRSVSVHNLNDLW